MQGATRRWRLTRTTQTNRIVIAHYSAQVRRLGYLRGTRPGDSSSSHRSWFRGDACIRVLITTDRLIILTAEEECAGGRP
ncbi:hypothetical protein DSM112329_02913 [Paraconexibacter sp. AEG42_29]|uniref:Uncharacterized protein n=1 Tax=Paraconexibacter sp. AEG42_29 TaxID=2997339 RepID=A0AAU7AWQ5_9ACTN